MRSCSRPSGSIRCSTSGCASGRAAARRWRFRSCTPALAILDEMATFDVGRRHRCRSLGRPRAAVAFLTRVPVGRWIALDGADVGARRRALPRRRRGSGRPGRPRRCRPRAGPSGARRPGRSASRLLPWLPARSTSTRSRTPPTPSAASIGHRALAIMRDSRVGSYGVTALALVLLVEVGSLGGLAAQGDAVAAFAAAGALSRAVSPPLACWLPYARDDEGPGSVLSGRVSAGGAAIGRGARSRRRGRAARLGRSGRDRRGGARGARRRNRLPVVARRRHRRHARGCDAGRRSGRAGRGPRPALTRGATRRRPRASPVGA